MLWEEFYQRFVNYKEEFSFKYNNYIIEILNGQNGLGFCCYVSYDISNESLKYKIEHRNDFIEKKEYDTPLELINNFKIQGRLLKEMWNEIIS